MGLFDKIKQGLKKTTQLLKTDVRDLFKNEGRLVDDAFLEELLEKLVKTDMGVQPAQQIVAEVGSQFRARVVEMDDLLSCVKAKLRTIMAQPEAPIQLAAAGPTVIMVAGVNGAGKTTSIAKLAYLLKSQGKKVVLGAGDTFRAAAVEQLTIWADRLGVPIVTGTPGGDPAAVAHKAVAQALAERGRRLHRRHRRPLADPAESDAATDENPAGNEQIDRRCPARSAAGFGRHDRPKRHQPGPAFHRGGAMYRHRSGQAGRDGQRGRGRGDSPASRPAGEVSGSGGTARRSDAVSSRINSSKPCLPI